MATFIDDDQENGQDMENEEVSNDYQEVEEQPEQFEPEEEELPERYRNKDVKEIIRMHQEAEKALGRQGSEVGELRRVVDDFIKAQLVEKQKQQAPEIVEEADFFVDPDKAVAKAIESHPKIKEAEQFSKQFKMQAAQAKLQQAHPDLAQIVGSQDFQNWVQGSKVRLELFVRADRQFDLDAAHELLSTYKERQQMASSAIAAEKSTRSQQVKQASTGTTQGSSETSKKIYRRQDIIELMRNDPDRYEALQPEIMKAYAERRVR